MKEKNVSTNGIGFTTILLIIFVVLKVSGVINWSWWVVILLPFGITIGLTIAFICLIFLFAFIIALFKKD